MASVTGRIKEIKQPRGGYIRPRDLKRRELLDIQPLADISQENVPPSNVGMAVDYLTRKVLGQPTSDAFAISMYGASLLGQHQQASELLQDINGLDKESIINACKLVGYDVVYRAGPSFFVSVERIVPNRETIYNIREMVGRGARLFDEYGPIAVFGPRFEGGYTNTVSKGDGDFLTDEMLWDFKTSVKPPDKSDTLQLVMYYVLGLHSKDSERYKGLKSLGFFNPRLGMIYTLDIDEIEYETLYTVERDVICYEQEDCIF